MNDTPSGFWSAFDTVAAGVPATLILSLASWAIVCVAGCVLALIQTSRSRVARHAIDAGVIIVRGIPELFLAFFLFYGLVDYVRMGPYEAAILALSVSHAGFASETFRAAFLTVHHGQRNAGLSLGMRPTQIFRLVVLPQALRFALVPLLNVLLGLTKASAIVSGVGVADVIYRGRAFASLTLDTVPATVAIVVMYLCLTIPMTTVVRIIDARMNAVGPRKSRRKTNARLQLNDKGANVGSEG